MREEFKLADVDKTASPLAKTPTMSGKWVSGSDALNTGNKPPPDHGRNSPGEPGRSKREIRGRNPGSALPSYLAAQRAHKIPIMTAGWLEDIHDAHNWYSPIPPVPMAPARICLTICALSSKLYWMKV